MKIKCFVTGATGFVGSYVVKSLAAAGHEVVAFSRSDDGRSGPGRKGDPADRSDSHWLQVRRLV